MWRLSLLLLLFLLLPCLLLFSEDVSEMTEEELWSELSNLSQMQNQDWIEQKEMWMTVLKNDQIEQTFLKNMSDDLTIVLKEASESRKLVKSLENDMRAQRIENLAIGAAIGAAIIATIIIVK